jgi:hypothetical protein
MATRGRKYLVFGIWKISGWGDASTVKPAKNPYAVWFSSPFERLSCAYRASTGH